MQLGLGRFLFASQQVPFLGFMGNGILLLKLNKHGTYLQCFWWQEVEAKFGVVCITPNRLILKCFILLLLEADFTLVTLTLNSKQTRHRMNVIFREEDKLEEELCSDVAFQCGKFKVLSLHHFNSSKWSEKITNEAQTLLTPQVQRLTFCKIFMLNPSAIWQEFREERWKWSGQSWFKKLFSKKVHSNNSFFCLFLFI